MKENDIIEVKVTKVHPSYVKVEYLNKETTLQITELTWKAGKFESSDYVQEGDSIRVKVIKVEGERFSVSMRQACFGGNPWDQAPTTGEEYFAPVVSITEFGIFFELTYYCHALMHNKHLSRQYQKGDRVLVRVVSADPERQRVEVIEAV